VLGTLGQGFFRCSRFHFSKNDRSARNFHIVSHQVRAVGEYYFFFHNSVMSPQITTRTPRYESEKLELQKELKLVQSHVAENVMRPAAQFPKDLISSVETYHPWIMLLSCHTDYDGNLHFADRQGRPRPVSRDAFVESFWKKLERSDRPTCLVLNTCLSYNLATEIVRSTSPDPIAVLSWASIAEDQATHSLISSFTKYLGDAKDISNLESSDKLYGYSKVAKRLLTVEKAFEKAREEFCSSSSGFKCGDPDLYRHKEERPHPELRGGFDPHCTGCIPPVHGVFCMIISDGLVDSTTRRIWCCETHRNAYEDGRVEDEKRSLVDGRETKFSSGGLGSPKFDGGGSPRMKRKTESYF